MLAFLLGLMVAYWWLSRKKGTSNNVNLEYFKGLNFLLNEEPDKAIEVFIKALEVDSETVELHLALGGLFRRKGQVDRATRIHQNLIARPNLTDEQRLQAIYELSQDYYKAGLLDRAESLFIELKDSQTYRQLALDGLSRIYQKEKEWTKAIQLSRQYKRNARGKYHKQIAHYWCELAEQAVITSEYEAAHKYLRNAIREDGSSARAILLRGNLHYQQQDFRRAITLWQDLSENNSILSALVIKKTIISYQRLNDTLGLRNYLQNLTSIPKEQGAFSLWEQTMAEEFGENAVLDNIFSRIQKHDLSIMVANYLYNSIDKGSLAESQQTMLMKELLERAKNRKIEYTCAGCGFDAKSFYWLCPNCNEWGSFN